MYWILNQSYFWRHLLGVAYNAYDIFAEMFVGVYRNVCLFVIIIKILTIDDTAWDDITRDSFEDESVDPTRHDTCGLEGRRRPGKLSWSNQSYWRSQSPGNYWRSWSSDGAHTSHETSNGTDACLPACLTDKVVFVVMSWADGRPRFHHPARNARRQITLGASWPFRNDLPEAVPFPLAGGPHTASSERRKGLVRIIGHPRVSLVFFSLVTVCRERELSSKLMATVNGPESWGPR